MVLKNKPILSILSTVVIFTFLWSQIVFAVELPLQNNITSFDPVQKNLPINLHKVFQKQLSRLSLSTIYEKIKPTLKYCLIAIYAKTSPQNQIQNYTQTGQYDRLGRIDEKYGTYDGKQYKWQAISYDELGRPTAYKEKYGKVSSKHYDIQYNELGDVSYEKIKTTSKSLFTKSKALNEYWYGYDEHGMLEKTKENEIYSQTSRTFWGKLFDVIIYGPLALLPDDIFFKYIKPAIDAVVGFLNPLMIPVIIALDFVRNIASGMEFGDALKGAAIQLVVWAITAGLSGGAPPPIEGLAGQELARVIATQAIKTLVTRVVFDLLEDKLGTFGAALVSALAGALVTTFSALPQFKEVDGQIVADLLASDFGLLTATGALDIWKIVGIVAQAGVTALLKEIIKNNPDLAWAEPLLETLLSTAVSRIISKIRQTIIEQKIKELEIKGYNVVTDTYGNVTLLIKIDKENGIIYYFTPDEKLQYSDQTIQKDGQDYIMRTTGLGYSEVYIRDKETGNYILLFKGEGWFNSIETYQNKEGATLQFISFTSPDGTTTYFELDGKPILTTLPDGRIISYNYNGQIEGILAKDALPYWTDTGKFRGSYIEKDIGTTYFDRNGNKEAFILEGYTPQEQNGRIIGQYKDIDKDTYIYRDTNGEFKGVITITPDGVYQNDGWWTTFFNNANISEWTRENYDNSPKYYYDADGINLLKVLTTQVNESGLIKGYTITDLSTGNFRQYNDKGELQAYYQARKDTQGNIIRYKGEDINGTQIIIDRDGNIHSTLTKEGIYTVYDPRDPSKIYYRIGPDTVYLVKTDGEVRFSIGYDPEKDKYILYDKLLTKITDNPVMLALKLNFSLFTMPREIAQRIINDAKIYLQIIKTQLSANDYYLKAGPTIVEKIKNNIRWFSRSAFAGDFVKPIGISGVAGQIVGGLSPVGDARDMVANFKTMITTGFREGKFAFLMATIGAAPLLGDGIKSLYKANKLVEATTEIAESTRVLDKIDEVTDAGKAIDNADEVIHAGKYIQEEFGFVKNLDELEDLSKLVIKTPYGDAVQSISKEALEARKTVENGATLYKIGTTGKSAAGEAQFWALEPPSPTFPSKYGIPPENVNKLDFVETGTIKPGTSFITREAPPFGGNPGGGVEIVVPENGVELKGYHFGEQDWD